MNAAEHTAMESSTHNDNNNHRHGKSSSSSRHRSRDRHHHRDSRHRGDDRHHRDHHHHDRRRNSSRDDRESRSGGGRENEYSKRGDRNDLCVYVSKLELRANESDVNRFFSSVCQVHETALVRDRKTNKSKGCGYVELENAEDVQKALLLNGLPFIYADDSEGGPIAVRLAIGGDPSRSTSAKSSSATSSSAGGGGPLTSEECRVIEMYERSALVDLHGSRVMVPARDGQAILSRRVQIRNISSHVEPQDLLSLLKTYGNVEQLDFKPGDAIAYVIYADLTQAADVCEHIQGRQLSGVGLMATIMRPPRGGGVASSSDETSGGGGGGGGIRRTHRGEESWHLEEDDLSMHSRPGDVGRGVPGLDAARRTDLMSKLAGGAAQGFLAAYPPPQHHYQQQQQPPVQSQYSMMRMPPPPPFLAQTNIMLIKNMFDPRTETDPNWAQDLALDTTEECAKFGTVLDCFVDVISREGRVYVKFDNVDAAVKAGNVMRGRWFAGRQLIVEFVQTWPR